MAEGAGLKPEFRIVINGADLSDEVKVDVREIVVKRHIDKASLFYVRLNDKGAKHVDSEDFPFGASVEIHLGSMGELSSVLEAEITAIYSEFREDGSMFTFRGMDPSHRMRRGAKHRAFAEVSDSDVLGTVVGDSGLSSSSDVSAPSVGAVLQLGISDHDLMAQRALRGSYCYRAEGQEVALKIPTYESSGVDLEFTVEVQGFDLIAETSDMPTIVQVNGWDMEAKETLKEEAAPGDEIWAPENDQFGPKVGDAAFGEGRIILQNLNPADGDEARTMAVGYFQRRSEEFVRGPVTIWGRPELKVGTLVNLTGMGEALGGEYLIRGLTHFYSDDGYFTRLEVAANCF